MHVLAILELSDLSKGAPSMLGAEGGRAEDVFAGGREGGVENSIQGFRNMLHL